MSRTRYKMLTPKDDPKASEEEDIVASKAADVDQSKLEPGCKPEDLVAWSVTRQLYTRLPLSNLDRQRATVESEHALQTAVSFVEANSTPVESPTTLSPSNGRRLKAAINLLRDEFQRLAANGTQGRLTLVIPFQDGDAQDIVCTPERRVRLK